MPPSGGAHGDEEQPREQVYEQDRSGDHLSRYVRDYLAQHGLSMRTLTRRAIDPKTGLEVQHGWISQLVIGRVSRAPELWRIRALAAGMGVEPRRLAELAALQWLSVGVAEVRYGGEDWAVVAIPPGMSQEDRRRLLGMVEDIARRMGQ